MTATKPALRTPGCGNPGSPRGRRGRWRVLVAVLALVASSVSFSAISSTPAVAAGPPPVLYKFLGGNNKGDDLNDEFRADFVVRVNHGETLTNVQYTFSPGGGYIAASAQTPTVYRSSIDQNYSIMSTIVNGPYDYLAISLHGDADWFTNCSAGQYGQPISMPIQVSTASGTVTIPNTITSFAYGYCAGVNRPTMSTTWDFAWGSGVGTSQDNFGLNIGSNGLGTQVADAGRFILDAINAGSSLGGAAQPADCGNTTSVFYQWVDQNNVPVASLTPTPVPLPVTSHFGNSIVPVYALENGSTTGTTAGFPSTFSFAAAGPGYYKLLAWPVATSSGTGAVSCVGRTWSPASIGDGWQVGSVFNDYAIPAPVAPVISTPATGGFTGSTTPTFTGTGIAGYTVTVAEGTTNLCTATVTAGGTWTCNSTTLTVATHTVTAVQIDGAGIYSPVSNTVAFTIDVTAPAAPVISAPANGTLTGNRTPAISGTGEPNATITVRDGATPVCTATVTAGGTWSCTSASLADGPHPLRATQTDRAGNASPASTAINLTVDGTAPAAPVVTAPATGSSTNVTTPTASGTGEPGATVTVREGAATICTAVVAAGGAWSCSAAVALGAGSHTWSVTQADAAGNVSAASSTTFTVDTTAPAAPVISAPTAGGSLTTATPTVTGTAESGSTVRVYDGATLVCTTTASAGGAFSCPTSALTDGAHVLTAKATDAAGNVSAASGAVAVVIDTAAPAAPAITSPAPGGLTNLRTPAVSGTGEPGAAVTVREGGTTLCSATVTAGGSWTCTPAAALADGPHSLAAVQQDTAGNVSPASSTVTFTVDASAPPAPAITSPGSASSTNTATPTLSGTAEPNATITVKDGGSTVCTAVADAAGNWSCTSAALADGPHTLTASARDAAGNVSPASAPITVTTDTAAPGAPAITSPAAGSVTSNTAPTLTGTGEPGSTVSVKESGTVLCSATVTAGGTWSCTPATAFSPGLHTLTTTQIDPAGNLSPVSGPIAFTVDTAAPAAPAITSPTSGTATNAGTPVLSGTAEANATVTVYDGATPVCTAPVDATGNWSCTSAPLSDGLHTISAKAADAAGNVSTASPLVPFTVDTLPPAAPVITAPAVGSATNVATPTFAGTGEPGSTVTVRDGGSALCTALVDGSGTWTCTSPTALGEGPHSITSAATDVAGNTGSASAPVVLTVDTTAPPAPSITAPAAGGTTGNSSPTVSGTAEAGSTVTVRDGPTTVCSAVADASGNFSCTPSTPLADGPHALSAQATDAVGNTGPASAPITVTVDTAAPAAPSITAPAAGSGTNDNTPTFTGTGEPGATVTVRDGGSTLCTAVVDGGGIWSCSPAAALTDGPHEITASATDPAGNPGPASAAITVTVDTATPAAPAITSPTNGQLIGTATPPVTGTAEPGSTVTVQDGGTTLCTATADPLGNFSCTPAAPLSDGAHSLTATATDPVGNTGPPSAPITVTVDTAAPPPPAVTSPTNGSATNSGTPTIAGTAEPGTSITVQDGGITLCTAVVAAGGTWTCVPATPLADGPHEITASATDPAGNTGPASAPITVSIDTAAPPGPAITAPATGAVSNATTPTISGTGEPGGAVTVKDGAVTICTTTVPASGSWTCTPATALAEGLHDLTATQTDLGGNVSPPSLSVVITVDTTAPPAPLVTGPAAGSSTDDSTPTVAGTGEPGATITVRDGAATLCSAVADASGNWSCTSTALGDGLHSVTTTATDPAGNTGPASSAVPFTIDTTPAAAPVVSSPAPGSSTNVNAPTFAGTGEPGATVAVTDAGVTLCTAVVDGAGVWACTSAVLADGPHTITATQTDPAGNISPASPPVTVTVDTAAPPAPLVTGPAVGSSTDDSTPTVAGTGEPGATITVRDGAVTLCTAVVDASGNWSCTSTALGDGPHLVTTTATDPAGNTGPASSAVPFTIDTTPAAAPVVSSPAPGSSTNVNAPTFAGTGEPGARVTVTDGGTTLCTTVVDAAGNWSCTSALLADGPHSITAAQTDAAGNTSPQSAPVLLSVDTAAPAAPGITSPAAGSSTNVGTPTIAGTGEPGATVTVAEAGTVVCTAVVDAAGLFSCTPAAPLGDGSHSLTATATDPAGNTGPASAPVTVTVDTAPTPAPQITGPVAGAQVNDSTPTVSGTGEPGSTVTVSDAGTTVCSATVDGTGNWTCTPGAPLTDGTHTLSALATDPTGNTGPASAPIVLTVDTAVPAAPAITGPAGGGSTNDSTPTVSGTGEPGSTVTVSDAGTTVCSATVDGTGNWTCTPGAPLTDGAHALTAAATDPAGNIGPASAPPISVTVDTVVPAAPTVTAPTGGTTITGTPVVTGSAEPGTTVTVNDGGTAICTSTADAAGVWSCTPSTPLGDGPHTITATATDPAGNSGPASAAVSITVDGTAPNPPAITAPIDGTSTPSATPTFAGTAEPGSSVTVTDGGSAVCTAIADAAGVWSCTPLTPLGDGPHTITATATDPAGNTGPASAPISVTTDTTAPVAPIVTSPANSSAINTATPTIAGTGEPGTTVTVADGGNPVCTATVDPAGDWSCTPSTPLTAGAHSLIATATDRARNTGAASAAVSVTVDTEAPPAPTITGPIGGATPNGAAPITGTGEPGTTVTVKDGGTTVCTAEVDAAGGWTCFPAPDIDDGPHTFTAIQTDLAGNNSPASPPVTVDVDNAAEIAAQLVGAVTDVNGSGKADLGDTISWTITVTNTGNVALGDVAAADAGGPVACASTLLRPGASTTCQPGEPTSVTQPQMDAGSVTNTATATGTTRVGPDAPGLRRSLAALPTGVPVTSAATAATVTLDSVFAMAISKSGTASDSNGDSVTDQGDDIAWVIVVSNIGNAGLQSVSVSDPTAGDVICPSTTLPVGGSMACTAPGYTITAGDASAGSVTNTASAVGIGNAGPVSSAAVTAVVLVVPTPTAASEPSPAPSALAVGPPTDGTAPAAGSLSYSGVPVLTGLGAAAALILGGWALLVLMRRRGRDERPI